MGEEKKEEGAEKKEEKQEDGNKSAEEEETQSPEIVLKVDMHCEACARKVARALKGFQGVENVTTDCKGSKVVVKGKEADPAKVCHRIQKKTGRKVELISPLPKPTEPPAEDKKPEENQPSPPPVPKKPEPPAVVTVVLKVQMHCEACAQVLQKRIRKIKGVESVTTDLGNNKVIVKGIVDPEKLATDVYKKTGKQALVAKEEEKKEEEKKEEEKKEEEEEKKKADEQEKKREEEEKKEEDIKKNEYWPHPSKHYYMQEYAAYPPQIFSDENPNACIVM